MCWKNIQASLLPECSQDGTLPLTVGIATVSATANKWRIPLRQTRDVAAIICRALQERRLYFLLSRPQRSQTFPCGRYLQGTKSKKQVVDQYPLWSLFHSTALWMVKRGTDLLPHVMDVLNTTPMTTTTPTVYVHSNHYTHSAFLNT